MSFDSDDQKSRNHDNGLIEKNDEHSEAVSNDINNSPKNINLLNDESSYDAIIDDNNSKSEISTKPIELLFNSDIKNNETDSNEPSEKKPKVHKPNNGSYKESSPRNCNVKNNENANCDDYSEKNSNFNENNEKKTKNLNNSGRGIMTIDSERPPSGYSEYSFSYEYSEVDIESVNCNDQPRSNRKERVKKKIRKTYPKYVPPNVNLTQEELSILKKKALNLEPLEDLSDDVYEVLIHLLAEDRKISAKSLDLKKGECLNDAIEHVTQAQLEQRKYNLQQDTYENYKANMSVVQTQLQQFDEETEALEKKLYESLAAQQKRLQEQHAYQIKEFTNEWNSISKRRQYNHASPRLIFLRKQFQQLMQQCRFKEATDVKAQITLIEKKEEAEATKVFQRNYDDGMDKLLKRQSDELKFLETRSRLQVQKFKQERELKRGPIENQEIKLKNMEERIYDPDKLWNGNQMKRTSDISKGKLKDAKVSPRLTAKDLDQKEETTINLPKLKIRKRIARPAL